MAGRGTDIKLGEGVVELGGLAVLGSEKHEARRIDNQLRGRAGRQGDPGYSRFYISAEDELMVRRGGERFRGIIGMMANNTKEGQPVTSRIISSFILGAQKRSESNNAEVRKNVLKYDDVMRIQREMMYAERTAVLTLDSMEDKVMGFVSDVMVDELDPYLKSVGRGRYEIDDDGIISHYEANFFGRNTLDRETIESLDDETLPKYFVELAQQELQNKKETCPTEIYQEFLKVILLRVIDTHWMKHIDTMSELRQGVRLQSYAQTNPLTIYQQEGKRLFDEMIYAISKDVTKYALLAKLQVNVQREAVVSKTSSNDAQAIDSKKNRKPKVRGKSRPWQ
jgi:preprotein translocase subunit SecA